MFAYIIANVQCSTHTCPSTSLSTSISLHYYPYYPHHPMSLHTIIWNSLYRAHAFKRAHAAIQIQAHYERKRLEKVGVTVADVWCIIIRFTLCLLLMTCSPTGWHGNSGTSVNGGHLTVRFFKADSSHFKMEHVYPTNEVYKRG